MPTHTPSQLSNIIEKIKNNKLASILIALTIFFIFYKDKSGNITAALVGGAITGFASYAALRHVEYNKIKEQKIQKCNEKIAFCQTLSSEISSLVKYYDKGMGDLLATARIGQKFEFYYPIFSNYFVIFENNTQKLSILEKPSRDTIIDCYNAAKALMDCYKFNNKMYDQMAAINALNALPHANTQACLKLMTINGSIMASYTQSLLEYDKHAKEQAIKAITALSYEENMAVTTKQSIQNKES